MGLRAHLASPGGNDQRPGNSRSAFFLGAPGRAQFRWESSTDQTRGTFRSIDEADAGELAGFHTHVEQGGYNVPNDEANTFVYEMIELHRWLVRVTRSAGWAFGPTSRRVSRRLDPASLGVIIGAGGTF